MSPRISYTPQTDTMAIQVRPWPSRRTRAGDSVGGEDAGDDLIIHYAADGQPWLWEIEHATNHPEHIVAALNAFKMESPARERFVDRLVGWLLGRNSSASKTNSSNSNAEFSTIPDKEKLREKEDVRHTYSPDRPIQNYDQDRFNRWPFARRIADTIAERDDESSLVVGLYGPWGDGKTSSLHLINQALRSHSNVVSVSFNPWYFESEERLLRGFFSTVAEAVGRSLPTKREEIGQILNKYGSLLSLASLSLSGGLVRLGAGQAAEALGKTLSNVELEDLRRRLESILREAGKRVVIMIDDIDRLGRGEIHAVFKLVKLSAGFDHTSYILAFDDDVVSAALGERYGSGGKESGQSFLEKIVQVPLYLPPADDLALRKFTFEGVDAALKLSGITLKQEDIDAFVRRFVDGLEIRLHTPRQAKLYTNALTFALPLLKGEVHPVDQMLIEGIRTFYPALYAGIRDNPSDFLKRERDNRIQAERQEQLLSRLLENCGVADKDQIKHRLLEPLFPRISSMGYGAEWDAKWAREQRVCSEEYFQRYFVYSIPPGDVSDLAITRFLERAVDLEDDQLDLQLAEFAVRDGMRRLIAKLRAQESYIDVGIARKLAVAIARSGHLLPREQAMLMSDWTFMQAAILVKRLIERVAVATRRDIAREVVEVARPLPFAFECFRWIRRDPDDPGTPPLIEADQEVQIGNSLADRIVAQADVAPIYRTFGADAPKLFYVWQKYGDAAQLETYLRAKLNEGPREVLVFLATYVGLSWGMESGLPHKSDFDRDDYNNLARYIDGEFILSKLRGLYGDELDAPEYYHSDETEFDKRLAHQFAFVHASAAAEGVGGHGAAGLDDGQS